MQTSDEIRAIADPVQRIAAVNAALVDNRAELAAITRDRPCRSPRSPPRSA